MTNIPKRAAPKVVVVGGSGFIGSAVMSALRHAGAETTAVHAPRLKSTSTSVSQIVRTAQKSSAVDVLARAFSGASAIVNAAGVANATDDSENLLIGANSLLPRVIREAAVKAGVPRYVHVSSASVQGRTKLLDESTALIPFSPYTRSKAFGERALGGCAETIIFRPTSVQGSGRAVTASLVRVAASKAASVAGKGDQPTPQVLVDNVGAAIAHVALLPGAVPPVVLQPSEGLTTSQLLEILGGATPTRIPRWVARSIITALLSLHRFSATLAANGRRAEMLWFGQAQVSGWLASTGWRPPVGVDGWRALAEATTKRGAE